MESLVDHDRVINIPLNATSFAPVATYPPQPATVRGQAVHLGEDPKGLNFLYTNGRSVIIRNIENPSIVTEYTGHSAAATVARYSPSGFYIASADVHGNIRIWDTTQAENILKTETRALSGRINDLAWDFESKRLIAVGEGKDRFGHAFLFDTASSVGEISGHSKAINSVSIKPGRPLRAVTCSDDMTVNFYHGVPFKFNKTLRDHSRFVQCGRYSPKGDFFVTAGMDSKIFLYDGTSGDLVSELSGGEGSHTGGILSVSWSPDGTHLLSASSDTTAKIWDVNSKKVVSTFQFSNDTGVVDDQQVGCLWQGNYLLSLSLGGDINYLNKSGGSRPDRVVKGHQKAITALVANPDKTFYTGSYDGRVLRWASEATGTARPVAGQGHTNQVTALSRAGDGIVSAGMDDTLRFIDNTAVSFISGSVATNGIPKGLVSIGNFLVSVTINQQIIITTKLGDPVSSAKVPWVPTAISASSTHIAVGDEDRKVHIYSFSGDGKIAEVKVLENNRGQISALAFSPDGKMLASGDKERMILVFDTTTWEVKISQWVFHNARINSISWSADSKFAVTGSLDTNVEVWSVEAPTKHVSIKGAHLESVNCVTFLDANTVLSAGQDGSVKAWNFQF